MSKLPAFQFYTGDWLKDPTLSFCSPATRGVWMDLLCAMHELNRSGELRGTTDQLARIARCSTVEFAQALTELQTTNAADVTERNGIYTIICRRMNREHRERLATNRRVGRHREKQKCNAPSSSSVSTSSSKEKQKAAVAADLVFPFDSEEFRKAWDAFVAMRREIGKPFKPTGAQAALDKLKNMGLTNALRSLENSTAGQWQGLFDPQQKANGSTVAAVASHPAQVGDPKLESHFGSKLSLLSTSELRALLIRSGFDGDAVDGCRSVPSIRRRLLEQMAKEAA